jgi:hypothetical protein
MQLTAHPIACTCVGCMSMRRTAIEIGLAQPGQIVPDSYDVTGYSVYISGTPVMLLASIMNNDTFTWQFESHVIDSCIDASNPNDI